MNGGLTLNSLFFGVGGILKTPALLAQKVFQMQVKNSMPIFHSNMKKN